MGRLRHRDFIYVYVAAQKGRLIMINDKEFDREIDCLKAHLGIFAYELEQSENTLEFIQNNDDYKFLIDKPDKGYTIRIRLSSSKNKKVLQRMDEKITEQQQAIDVKNRVDYLYQKYISLAKKSNDDNKLSPYDFFGSAKKIFERNSIIAKLEILQEILGYDYDRIKHDIERAE